MLVYGIQGKKGQVSTNDSSAGMGAEVEGEDGKNPEQDGRVAEAASSGLPLLVPAAGRTDPVKRHSNSQKRSYHYDKQNRKAAAVLLSGIQIQAAPRSVGSAAAAAAEVRQCYSKTAATVVDNLGKRTDTARMMVEAEAGSLNYSVAVGGSPLAGKGEVSRRWASAVVLGKGSRSGYRTAEMEVQVNAASVKAEEESCTMNSYSAQEQVVVVARSSLAPSEVVGVRLQHSMKKSGDEAAAVGTVAVVVEARYCFADTQSWKESGLLVVWEGAKESSWLSLHTLRQTAEEEGRM